MNPLLILRKKRFGEELTEGEIRAFVSGVTDGSFAEYQISALLMAIAIRGMTDRETLALALAMQKSGASLSWKDVGIVGDKHSTGGVGDDTTFISTPIAAACGAKMALMSGRGLGHTGGTLDKLASIPGLRTDLGADELKQVVRGCGCAVIGQTGEFAPADRVLYAMRDVTETVDCLPLIAASITSKKLAFGCDHVILDVKTGNGAMMREREDAVKLARMMVNIGRLSGKRYRAMITDMSQPLGTFAGNAMEMRESIEVLRGKAGGDLRTLSLAIAARSIHMAGIARTLRDAENRAEEALETGAALAKFREMVSAQGGDARFVDDPELLPRAAHSTAIRAAEDGYLAEVGTPAVGNAARALGAGRYRTDDKIDLAAGVAVKKRIGDAVRTGETIAVLEYNDTEKRMPAMEILKGAFKITKEKAAAPRLIYDEID